MDEKVRKLAEYALSKLSAELEAGQSDALRKYLGAMGRFHRYSWSNALLIHSQRPDATNVAGFHAWDDLGRWVKKGEKGIVILAPVVTHQKLDSITSSQTPNEDKGSRLTGFRTAYVFDQSQTEGRALPEFSNTTGDPADHTEKLKALAAKQGIAVDYDPNIAPAQGVSSGGRIQLVPGMAPAEEFSVLTHELAHEMLHHDKSASPVPKIVRETQAEAVAFVVSHAVGLEGHNAAADYITLYSGDKRTLADSLAVIQETSAKILSELLPEKQIPSQEPLTVQSGAHEIRPPAVGQAQDAATPNMARSPSAAPTAEPPPVWDR